jgi:hypothetical protein
MCFCGNWGLIPLEDWGFTCFCGNWGLIPLEDWGFIPLEDWGFMYFCGNWGLIRLEDWGFIGRIGDAQNFNQLVETFSFDLFGTHG